MPPKTSLPLSLPISHVVVAFSIIAFLLRIVQFLSSLSFLPPMAFLRSISICLDTSCTNSSIIGVTLTFLETAVPNLFLSVLTVCNTFSLALSNTALSNALASLILVYLASSAVSSAILVSFSSKVTSSAANSATAPTSPAAVSILAAPVST